MTNIIIMSFVVNRFITSIKFVDTNQLLFYLPNFRNTFV